MKNMLKNYAYDKVCEKKGSQICFKKELYTLEGLEPGDFFLVSANGRTLRRIARYQYSEPENVRMQCSFFMAWALYSIDQELPSALANFSEEEKIAIIGSLNTLLLDGESAGPDLFAQLVWDYMHFDEGMLWGWSDSEKRNLANKIADLTRTQAAALMVWGKRYWQQEDESLEEYIAAGFNYLTLAERTWNEKCKTK